MTDITFYTHPQSRGRIARWMLEEVGAEYETVVLEYGGSMHDDDYAAINPMRKVPAIRRGEAVVTETAAICAYLADAFPDAGLAPPPTGRAAYYRWLFFAAGPMESAITNRALGVKLKPEQQGFVGYGDFERLLNTVEAAVDNDGWIAGASFSAADVYLGAQLNFGLQFETIDKRPAFERYVARATDRDAFRRALKMDEEALASMS